MMTIAEITSFTGVEGWINDAPFVFSALPGDYQAADYWTTTFGAPDESRNIDLVITDIIRDFSNTYLKLGSRQECIDNEGSFFWDQINQKLYLHIEHDFGIEAHTYQYGSFFGFSDKDMIYVGNQEYLPQLRGTPSLKQKQDLLNYDRLAFLNGSIKLDNTGGELDSFIDVNVYGNDVFIYYINDDDIITDESGNLSCDRDCLRPLASFYVEDYDISLKTITVKVQDKRKAQSATVAGELFTATEYPDISEDVKGLSIPLVYGSIREMLARPVNGALSSGNVDFKVWQEGTSLGTIQVLIDNIWTTVTPTASNATLGTFTLLSSDARDASGYIRDCKVVNAVGIPNTYSSDVIKDLNERYLGEPYNSTFYDTTEWEAEETSLEPIGVVFESEIELFEAIRLIQDGSNIGFRYEIGPTGLKTIRIDNESRTQAFRVPNTDISNIDDLPVATDSDNLYSDVRVKYAKSYVSGKYLSTVDETKKQEVLRTYRQARRLTTETLIVDEATAEARALSDAEKFSVIPPVARVILSAGTGSDADTYLSARIFDIIQIELTPADFIDVDNNIINGREYYGIKTGKIIGVDPKPDQRLNTLEVKLL